MKLCSICHKRPAAVPDRNISGRQINRICFECHTARLRNDLKTCIDNHPNESLRLLSKLPNVVVTSIKSFQAKPRRPITH